MSKNCYISNSNVLNLNMFYRLMTYGYINLDEYDISKQKFQRYIANIRYMLQDYFVFDIQILFDKENKRYILKRA